MYCIRTRWQKQLATCRNYFYPLEEKILPEGILHSGTMTFGNFDAKELCHLGILTLRNFDTWNNVTDPTQMAELSQKCKVPPLWV
jgi:hypothetical protein